MRIIFMVTGAAFLTGAAQYSLVDVTLPTINLQVNTFQQEVLVIFTGVLPAAFIVTLGTVRSVGPFVHILVTSHTVLLFHLWEEILTSKVLGWRLVFIFRIYMTFGAFYLLVFAFEFELRFRVIEILEFDKFLRRVTDATGLIKELGAEHFLMFIHMAFFTKPAISPFKHELTTLARRLGRQNHIARLMTVDTLFANFCVTPCEFKAGDVMIKFRQLRKAKGRVAGGTGLLLKLGTKLFFMNGIVAIYAVFFILTFIEIEKMRRLRWSGWELIFRQYMTLHTVFLDLLMLAIDLEVGNIVIKRCSLRKVTRRMTLGTRHADKLFVKLLFVYRVMTGDAEIFVCIWKLIYFLAFYDMACLAARGLMLAREWIPSSIMKAPIRLDLILQTHDSPAFGPMAFFTANPFELLMKARRMGSYVTGSTAFLG